MMIVRYQRVISAQHFRGSHAKTTMAMWVLNVSVAGLRCYRGTLRYPDRRQVELHLREWWETMDRKQVLFYDFWIQGFSTLPLKIFALHFCRLYKHQAHFQQIVLPSALYALPALRDTCRPFSKVFSVFACCTYILDRVADIAHRDFPHIWSIFTMSV